MGIQILAKVLNQANSVQVKNVTDQLLKLIMTTFSLSTLSFIVAGYFKLPYIFAYFSLGFTAIAFLLYIGMYIYFAIEKPDYLRSETYHLIKNSMEIIGNDENMSSKKIDAINTTAQKYLESNNKSDKENKND